MRPLLITAPNRGSDSLRVPDGKAAIQLTMRPAHFAPPVPKRRLRGRRSGLDALPLPAISPHEQCRRSIIGATACAARGDPFNRE
jgi:hypothetical protein